MRPDHAARVANAVRAHLFADIEIAPPYGAWSRFRGAVRRDWYAEEMPGFVSRTGEAGDALHLDAADFAPATGLARPEVESWVRYVDDTGVTCVRRLAEPLREKRGGRFIWGPLKKPDRDAVIPPGVAP